MKIRVRGGRGVSEPIDIKKLRALIDSKGVSDAEFARTYGIDPSYLSKILSGKRKDPQKLIIQLLCRGVKKKDIFLS
jgi:transcriptional regulator with XRE-family HTH domain